MECKLSLSGSRQCAGPCVVTSVDERLIKIVVVIVITIIIILISDHEDVRILCNQPIQTELFWQIS